MKGLKRFIALLLAGVASVSLFACGGGGGSSSIDENEDVEEITFLRNDIEGFNTARKQNTPVYQALKQAIGVDVEVISAAGSSWTDILNKLWFSQELPDMFLCKGPDEPTFYNKLIKGGDIIAIDDYVNESTKDEYPNLYSVMSKTSYLANNLTYAKGKQWAVPCSWELEKSLYVRQDWIDNLNAKLAKCLVGEGVIAKESDYTSDMYEQYKYTVPEDLLEFYRLARAFTLYDPDNNNKNDTYGYESESNTDMDAWIYVAFGTGWHSEILDTETNKYIATEVHDGSKYATAFINRLMAEGYMNPNSLTNDNSSKQNDFSTGVSGMIFAHNWLNTFVGYMMDSANISLEEATSRITMCDPPKGKNGEFGADGGYDNFWQFTCINANRSQKRIKTCLKLLDYMYSQEGLELFSIGIEGVHYKVGTDGKRENLMGNQPDSEFSYTLGSFDSAYQLYSLGWWSGHYWVDYTTNGEIIAARQAASSQYAFKVDYPYVQTTKYLEKIDGLRDYFDETSIGIIADQKGKYWKAEIDTEEYKANKYNYLTFGWDDIYYVPRSINTAWSSFVNSFNTKYSGTDVYEEYNQFIASGKAQKKSGNGLLHNALGQSKES